MRIAKLIVIIHLLFFSIAVLAQPAFVAVGDYNNKTTVLISDDGQNWQKVTNVPNTESADIIFDKTNKIFIIANSFLDNDLNSLLYSNDGIHWIQKNNVPIYKVRKLKNRFFGLQRISSNRLIDGYVHISKNGIDYKPIIHLPNITLMDIAYGNNNFVMIDDNGAIFTSKNGYQWSTGKVLPSFIKSLIFTDKFVGVGWDILVSYDGFNWKKYVPPFQINSIAYNKDIYVVVGDNGAIATSYDGIKYSPQPLIVHSNLNKVIWSERTKQFIVVGNGGEILTSPNGKDWSFRDTGTDVDLVSVAGV